MCVCVCIVCKFIYLFIYIQCVSQKVCNAEVDRRDIEAEITRRAASWPDRKSQDESNGDQGFSLPSLWSFLHNSVSKSQQPSSPNHVCENRGVARAPRQEVTYHAYIYISKIGLFA